MVLWRLFSHSRLSLPRAKPFLPAHNAARLTGARQSSTVSPTPIAHLLSSKKIPPGATVKVNGFIRSLRKQKRVAFAAIGDGSSYEPLQAVLSPGDAEGLSTGTSVSIVGEWHESPSNTKQTHELQVHQLKIQGDNDATTYPIQKKYQTSEFLRTLPHLRCRLPHNALLLHLRSRVIGCVTSFFSKQGFLQTHPPVITSSDCEGAGEVFTVHAHAGQSPSKGVPQHFFRSPKYLTVSAQLHLEALAQSVGKVWTLSPAFRAEKSDTSRHLSEFYMLEAEMCFVDHVSQIMDVVEAMLREVAQDLLESQIGKEILAAQQSRDVEERATTSSPSDLERRWRGLTCSPWPRITYVNAITVLQEAVSAGKAHFEFAPTFDLGLQAEHERFIAEEVGKNGPVFITDYPRHIKPFYMAPSSNFAEDGSGQAVACFDLLVPEICELVGGSMREHRFTNLQQAMELHGLKQMSNATHGNGGSASGPDSVTHRSQVFDSASSESSSLQWYADLRRYGSVPHGGFGLGFDRLLGYLSGVSNIRDVVAFPRWHGRCDC